MTVDPSLAAIVRLLAMRTPAQSERQVLEVCAGAEARVARAKDALAAVQSTAAMKAST